MCIRDRCPRQRLKLEAPPPLIESIDYHNCSFVMVGSDKRTRQPNTHREEVTVDQRTDAEGGGAIITRVPAHAICAAVISELLSFARDDEATGAAPTALCLYTRFDALALARVLGDARARACLKRDARGVGGDHVFQGSSS